MHRSGLGSRLNLKSNHSHCNDMQALRGLGSTQRASSATFKEAWTAQASYNEDGTGSHDIYR